MLREGCGKLWPMIKFLVEVSITLDNIVTLNFRPENDHTNACGGYIRESLYNALFEFIKAVGSYGQHSSFWLKYLL